MSVLKLEKVSKSFDEVKAVQDLNLELPQGVIFGLLGPNGAGKTTTIRMIMNIIIPDEGQIYFQNEPLVLKFLDNIGYLPEERGLYRKMKVGELLTFLAELKGVRHSAIKGKLNYWLERFELLEWADKKVEMLSKGMQQKVQFIATILHSPQIIILDEPFMGLDPINSQLVKDVMNEQKKEGKTVIFSTHLMEQVEQMCDSICLINAGQAVLNGSLRDIKKKFSDHKIRLEYDGDAKFLQDTRLVKSYQRHDHFVEIILGKDISPQQILQQAVQQVTITRFEMMEPTLNEIFIKTVKPGKEEK